MSDKKNMKMAMFTFMVSMLMTILVISISVYSTTYLTEIVSTESTYTSLHPSLEVDPDGNIHVVWHNYTGTGGWDVDHDVLYKAKIGGSWTTTEVVSTESTKSSYHPSIAIDADGNIYVVWYDFTDYEGSGNDVDVFYKAKIDGSWTTTEVVSTESTKSSYHPSLAVDADGNIHVAWQDFTDYGGAGILGDLFYKAKIGGRWTTTEVVSTESILEGGNEPSLVIDPGGNIHVAWFDSATYDGSGRDKDVFYKTKIDGSWTTTEVVSTESTGGSYRPSLVIDLGGNIHVAWFDRTEYDGSGGDVDIFYKAKIDGSWTTTEVVSTESIGDSRHPSLAVDPDGDIHVTWNDNMDYGGSGSDADIFYKTKIDGSWTTTEVVSTESTFDSEYPSLVVDPDRKIHMVWCDSTNYGGSGSDVDVFYKRMDAVISLSDVMKKLGDLESKVDSTKADVDDIEAKLENETRFADDSKLSNLEKVVIVQAVVTLLIVALIAYMLLMRKIT